MKFQSFQIKGRGRGRILGIPTINLQIPEDFSLENGIYAALVKVQDRTFLAAMHFGPIPTFNESAKSLEVLLIDVTQKDIPETENQKIVIEVKQRLRGIIKFKSASDMVEQIKKDIDSVKNRLLVDNI